MNFFSIVCVASGSHANENISQTCELLCLISVSCILISKQSLEAERCLQFTQTTEVKILCIDIKLLKICTETIQFKVDRLQIIVVAKKYIYVSQLFISRMPKMRAIPQLVSAPLNPIPIAEHFRKSHPPCEHSRGQHM